MGTWVVVWVVPSMDSFCSHFKLPDLDIWILSQKLLCAGPHLSKCGSRLSLSLSLSLPKTSPSSSLPATLSPMHALAPLPPHNFFLPRAKQEEEVHGNLEEKARDMLNWQHFSPSPLLPTTRQVGRKEVVAQKQHQKKVKSGKIWLQKC